MTTVSSNKFSSSDHTYLDSPQSNYSDNDYYYSYGYEDFYYTDHLYQIYKFEVPIYGYLWPILVLFTTFCNLIVIGGFLRKLMRNPTNLILVFIALSDSLTGLATLPATFHIFPKENYVLSKEWCEVAMITRLFVSRAFHTVSVWETLLLGVHRYLQLKRPEVAQKMCTTSKTIIAVALMYVASFLLHKYHAFDIKATSDGLCQWTIEDPCGWTCVYIWCTLILSHLLPCLTLVFLAADMIRSLNNTRLSFGTATNRAVQRRRSHKNITLVVILVAIIFLIPELPYGIFYLVTVSLRHNRKQILPLKTNRLIHCLYEVLLIVSFHMNFWVYCVMISRFRACVKGMLRLMTGQPVDFDRLENDMTSSGAKDIELVGITAESDTDQTPGKQPRHDTTN